MFSRLKTLLAKLFIRNLPAGANYETADALRAKLSSGVEVYALAANSGSMFPVIRGGERIRIENFPYENLTVGRFVVGTTNFAGVISMHEIIHGDPNRGFTTKGRASPEPDPFLLTPERYIGVWRLA